MNSPAPEIEALARPPRGRVLCLAPHPDDELIGCGGTLALHREQGDPVRVVVAFDGALGADPGVRRAEALRGGAHLGLADYRFLDHAEGHAPSGTELAAGAARLLDELREFAPDLVYSPWAGDGHRDHRVLARAAALALAEFPCEAWAYEVWTPLRATRVVDVSPVWERVLAALAEHESQLAGRDLVRATSGLAAHRSLALAEPARFGEAFERLQADRRGERAA